MFFITLLLESLVTWTRRQTGTTSLRALLYFDEIFGFFPATSEPPSKRPLLALLKQARAFGLGVVLAAQNPIDIDYKGLTNAGTWFIGRLQAQRDKERVLQGLKGAITEVGGRGNEVDFEAIIGQLRNRVFLVHNIHNEQPMLMQTRWVMSYLRGPLTKPQVSALMADRKAPAEATPPVAATPQLRTPPLTVAPAPQPVAESVRPQLDATSGIPRGFNDMVPSLDPGVSQVYLPLEGSEARALRQLSQQIGRQLNAERAMLIYEPAIVGVANVRFVDRKRRINEQVEKVLLAPAPAEWGGVDWDLAEPLPLGVNELIGSRPAPRSEHGPYFAPAPESANDVRKLKAIERSLADWLYYNSRLSITVHSELDLFHRPEERERAFKMRLRQVARERRDAEVDKLEDKYESRIDRLEARMRKERRELIGDQADYDARKREEHLTLGETVVSFLMGRRRTRAISTVARKRRLSEKAKLDIEESLEEIDDLEEDIAELEGELEEEAKAITRKWADLLDDLTIEELHPRRTDVDVRLVALAWLPSWLITYDDGIRPREATMAAYLPPEGNSR
jgi:hypothetical protein